jgi:hypothetical protein
LSPRAIKSSSKICKKLYLIHSQMFNGLYHLQVLRASSKISKMLLQESLTTKSWSTSFCIGNSRESSRSEKKGLQVLTGSLLQNKILYQLKLSWRKMVRLTRLQLREMELTKAKRAWPRSCVIMVMTTVLYFKQDQTCTSLSRISSEIQCS